MASKQNSNKIINGTFGNIWVNGELWGHCKSFEAKVAGEFEDVTFAEDLGMHKKYMGFTGEGTVVLHKMYSNGAKILGDAFKTGIMPDIKIVGKLADPASYGAERVEILEVTFDEFMLLKFANKEIQEEELPFKFADYNLIDVI